MNQFTGRVSKMVECDGLVFAEVAVGESLLSATFVGSVGDEFRVGAFASVKFKEIEVALAKGLSGKISLRNRIKGQVQSIEDGRVISRIQVLTAMGPIRAVITKNACVDLAIAIGDDVECLIKSNEVIIESASAGGAS